MAASVDTIDTVHRINSCTCFFIGIALNSTMIWLIVKKSSEEVRHYSRILLQTAFVDLAYLTVGFLYSPVVLIGSGQVVIYGVGILIGEDSSGSAAVRPRNFALYNIWSFMFYFSQYSASVPFIHRYFTLCRERSLPLSAYTTLLVAVGLASATSLPIDFLANEWDTGEREELNRLFFAQPTASGDFITTVCNCQALFPWHYSPPHLDPTSTDDSIVWLRARFLMPLLHGDSVVQWEDLAEAAQGFRANWHHSEESIHADQRHSSSTSTVGFGYPMRCIDYARSEGGYLRC